MQIVCTNHRIVTLRFYNVTDKDARPVFSLKAVTHVCDIDYLLT